MITIRPGSRVQRLLFVLSIAGEFPIKSLHLLGQPRDLKKLIRRLEKVEEYRAHRTGPVIKTRLVIVSGKNPMRSIRLYKSALHILNELHPEAFSYYMDAFGGHNFPGDIFHLQRNHRVSEVLAMCMMAGLEIRPYILPKLQKTSIQHIVPDFPCFYIARDFKKIDAAEMNKTQFTRIVGALFYPSGVFAIYNTRDTVMKWSGMGEFKTAHYLLELTRMNAGLNDFPSAMLLGNNPNIALQTLIESDKSRRLEMRFDRIYQHIHFIPLDQDGIRLMKILTTPDWNEKILSVLFTPEMRPAGYGFMEYDAYWNKTYIYSHLDSDIARLVRFKEALVTQEDQFEVLCYSWQTVFLEKYLGERVVIKQLEMDMLEKSLGLNKCF